MNASLRSPLLRVSAIKIISMLLLSAVAAPAATYYVTISGLGGEADYEQRFKMWAEDIDATVKKSGAAESITMVNATREQIRGRFADLARTVKADDALVVMLIGHGTYDGVDYKFNLTGPDLTATELASLLDRVPATRQCVVNMTSSSGGSIAMLRRNDRIVITATKAGTEKNATVFARYWADALRDPGADTDKNDSISALEAFRYAERKVTDYFETQKRLATEHALLEDSGRGDGERNPSPENGEGKLAGAFTVVRLGANAEAAANPATRALIEKKESLEQAIEKLKYEKAAMPAEQYKRQLTQLLLELAKTQEALDRGESK